MSLKGSGLGFPKCMGHSLQSLGGDRNVLHTCGQSRFAKYPLSPYEDDVDLELTRIPEDT